MEVRGQMSYLPVSYFIRQGFLPNLRFIVSAKRASQWASRIYLASLTPLTPSQMSADIPDSLCSFWDPNQHPHGKKTGTLVNHIPVLPFTSVNQLKILPISLFPFLPRRKVKDAHNKAETNTLGAPTSSNSRYKSHELPWQHPFVSWPRESVHPASES